MLRRLSMQSTHRACLIFFAIALSAGFASAQQPAPDSDRDAVKKVVETFLYAEEEAEVRSVVAPDAKIMSVTSEGKLTVVPVGKSAKKLRNGETTRVPRQRIVNTDIFEDGAVVKVETDQLALDGPTKDVRHMQYFSLLKTMGEWKIVSILMPSIRH
jgi:Putative lumazine-binding